MVPENPRDDSAMIESIKRLQTVRWDVKGAFVEVDNLLTMVRTLCEEIDEDEANELGNSLAHLAPIVLLVEDFTKRMEKAIQNPEAEIELLPEPWDYLAKPGVMESCSTMHHAYELLDGLKEMIGGSVTNLEVHRKGREVLPMS